MGTLKGVGQIYEQTFIETYSKVGFANLYDRKIPLTAADLLNDRVLPFFGRDAIPLSRCSPIAAPNTVAPRNGMNMNSISQSRILITPDEWDW